MSVPTNLAARLIIALGTFLCLDLAAHQEAVRGTSQISNSRTPSHLSPPLLKVTKDYFSAYLLPESHIGSPLEFGPYFRSVVLLAARRSSTLVYEGINGDTYPGNRYWGRTCLEENRDLVPLAEQLTARIVSNHRHSQWADLWRAFSEKGEAFALEQFTAFIGARGLMINFWELDLRIHPLVEQELAMSLSVQPQVTSREYSAEHGARERISRVAPHLQLESIETLDDRAWAICQLSPAKQREALERAIEHFDNVKSRTRALKPGSRLRQAETGFAALHAQLRTANIPGYHPARNALNTAAGSLSGAGIVQSTPFLRGEALDKLRFGLRNERWAERIDGHAALGRRGLFYVLGSDHLRDFDHSAGLLTLLRQRGFRVEVVQ